MYKLKLSFQISFQELPNSLLIEKRAKMVVQADKYKMYWRWKRKNHFYWSKLFEILNISLRTKTIDIGKNFLSASIGLICNAKVMRPMVTWPSNLIHFRLKSYIPQPQLFSHLVQFCHCYNLFFIFAFTWIQPLQSLLAFFIEEVLYVSMSYCQSSRNVWAQA